MKALKYALYALGGLIILLIVVVGIVFATFDPNAYKPQIVQMVKERTGRTLTIDGKIRLKIFPKIGAAVGKTTLSERDNDKEFAGVDGVQVYLALLPLHSKQIVVDEVRVDGLRANFIKFKDGTTNFADLTGGGTEAPRKELPKPAETRKGEATPQKPMKLDISGIRITRSRVTWRDETNGNDLAVELTQLKTGRLVDRIASPVDLDMTVKEVKTQTDLNVRLTGTLTFDLEDQQYRLKSLDAKLTGSARGFSIIAATVKGDIDAAGATQAIRITGLDLEAQASRGKDSFNMKLIAPSVQSSPEVLGIDALSLSATGTVAGVTLNESSLKVPTLRFNLATNQILLERLALFVKGKMGTDSLDIYLTAPKLEVSSDKASGESVLLTAKLAGAERNANLAVGLSAVQGSAKALEIAAVTLNLDAKQKDNTVKGTLSTPLLGNLETRTFELPRIAGDFTVITTSIPQKSVKILLSGNVRTDLAKERVVADILTKFDESNVKAKLGMTKFAAPAYDFDISVDKLNIDRYLQSKQKGGEVKPATGKPAGPTTSEAKAPESGAKQLEQRIDLSPLKALNLDGGVKIGELVANNIKASSVRVDVRAKDGKLDVSPMHANLYQGSLNGSVSVNANTNQIAAKQTLTGISIGPLLRDAIQQDILDGRGNVTLDLTTGGNSVTAFKKALSGTAGLSLKDGAIKGVDLAGAIRNIKARLSADDEAQGASKTEKTDFSELTASFTVRNGVAHNGDLRAKSPFLRISGEGDVNLAEDSLDYVVQAAVVATTSGQGGKDREELSGLTLPVRIYGPYTGIKYKMELSQMLSGAGKEALKEAAKAALKGGGKVQLKELGKQLFGEGDSAAAKSGRAAPDRDPAQQAAPKQPEDQIKDKLKGLLR